MLLFRAASYSLFAIGSLERQRQALGGPAGFHEFIERQRVSRVPACLQPFYRFRATLRQHDLFGDTDRVAGKTERLRLRHHQAPRLPDSLRNGRLRIAYK